MSQPEPAVDTTHTHTYTSGLSRAELTPTSQSDGDPSPPLSPAHDPYQDQDYLHQSDTLTFPTLESDGSLPDLLEAPASPRRYHTPPAALSSLGARLRMAEKADMSGSIDSLEDSQYDMVEDASEISTNDGHETASLTSTDHAISDDEGQMTPDEDDTVEREEGPVDLDFGSVGDLAGTLHVRKEQSTIEANKTLDSIMSEDLETPRQSLIGPSVPLDNKSPPSTSNTLPAKHDAAPTNLNVVLCHSQLSNDMILSLASETAWLLALKFGTDPSACKIINLPSTPDSSEGARLFRYEDLDITIYATNMSTSGPGNFDFEQTINHDLIVAFVSRGEDHPHGLVDAVRTGNTNDVPMLVVAETVEQKIRLEGKTECGVVSEEMFIYDDMYDALADFGIDSILATKLEPKGWQPPPSQKSEVAVKRCLPTWTKKELPTWMTFSSGTVRIAIGALVLALLMPFMLTSFSACSKLPAVPIETQRQDLAASLANWTTVANSKADIHWTANRLLPRDHLHDFSGDSGVAIDPNKLVISMAALRDHPLSDSPVSKIVRSPDVAVVYNVTGLAPGVYGITFPVEEAYGRIDVRVHVVEESSRFPFTGVFGKRAWNTRTTRSTVVFKYDFGNRTQPCKTRNDLGTDLAKTISKDVAVARKAARSLTDKVGLELSAGVAATQNVTTQLAIRMTRDVQVFAKTAAGVLGKMASTSASSAEKISKDLVVVRKDLIKRADDFKKSVATTAHSIKDLIVPTKKTLSSPLAASRQRALGLKDAAMGKKEKINAKSAEGEAGRKLTEVIERELGGVLEWAGLA